MIHNRFFLPYPLQTVLNAIREYGFSDTIRINRILSLVDFKNNVTNITIFDCVSSFEGKTSPLLLINYNKKILISSGHLKKFGKKTIIFYGHTVDLEGVVINLKKLIPRWATLNDCSAQYLSAPVDPIDPTLPTTIMNDPEFISLIVTKPTIRWAYDIDLIKQTATHVIQLVETRT